MTSLEDLAWLLNFVSNYPNFLNCTVVFSVKEFTFTLEIISEKNKMSSFYHFNNVYIKDKKNQFIE